MIDEQEKFEELLCDWETARQQGREMTVEELCSQHPQLLDRVRKGIDQLRATSWMLNDEAQLVVENPVETLEAKRRSGETQLPESDFTISEFIQFTSDSGILSATDMDRLNDHARQHQQSPVKTFATELVENSILTEYQARAILEKGNSPLLLDRYIVLDTIGSGGMGLVFKAVHRSMERVVALKVLPRFAVNSPEKVNRFQREIKATAKLSHPNVVAAYDAHESNGTFFLVLEYVDGVNLMEHVETNGPLPVEDAVRIIAQVSDGLEEAHRNGIIHRDIKPTNLMLSTQGVAKLLDLGLARTRELVQETTPNELTRDGLAMGTVDYMSPEQALDSKQVDARSDLYSLGCTLYFLLTGHAPFERSTTVKTIVAHREDAPPSLIAAREDVPKSLEKTYLRMLAKDPAERFRSVADFRNELLSCGILLDTSIQTEPDSKPRITVTPPQRNQRNRKAKQPIAWTRWLPAISLLVLAMVIGWFIYPWITGSGLEKSVSQRDIAKWVLSGAGEVDIESELGKQTLSYLDELPDSDFHITGLELQGDAETLSLKPIGKLEQLTTLEIYGYHDFDLDQLKDLPSLIDLTINGPSVTDKDLEGVNHLSHLISLDVSITSLTDKSLSRILEMNGIKDLYLSENQITHGGIRRLRSMSGLRKLALDSTEFDGTDIEYLPRGLTQLFVSGCSLKDEDADELQRLPQLAVLDIRETEFTQRGISQLATLNLAELYVDGTSVSESTLQALGQSRKLTLLSLDGLNVTQGCIDAILKMPGLQTLSLDGSNLNDKQLMQLVKAKNLTTLHVVQSNVTEEGIVEFLEAMPDCDVYTDLEYGFE